MTSIPIVGDQAYLLGLNPVQETGDCLTHVAGLHHPTHGRAHYFVKHYIDGPGRTRGIANEVCGYLLAEAAGVPLAGPAMLVELPSKRIQEMHPARAAGMPGESVLAWAIEDAGGEALPRSIAAAAEPLRRWPFIGALIAFDAWVVIPDRSPENLVRTRSRQIVSIDYGHLGGSLYWQSELLPIHDEARHPFLSLWQPGGVPDEINQRIIMAAEGHAACLERARPQLDQMMEPLLGDAEDRIALLRFLEERARSSPARMKRMLDMLV
ncbi:MAG: hypothetical protein ACT4P4_18205 [Betaproteobacteria bacterium]